ncbi:MAG: sugar phosphate isomerase/epimerase [Chloroflexota bacterium]|nr:sugar phosphate isomerase/epimerase [Chloroflexota bacterium]
MEYAQLRLGTAPDSWGVWNPGDDPLQIPWSRYMDEAQAAGYRWVELGPYGYSPTDPAVLDDELAKRDLRLTGGTVFAALHKGKDALAAAKNACDLEAATLTPLGAKYLILLPEGYTDFNGNLTASPDLSDDQWNDLNTGMSQLAKYIKEEHGLELVFHSHADSHVGTQQEIVRFLDGTDPTFVNLCLDTGHVAYCGADSLAIIEQYPERIHYVHLKQVDRAIRQRVIDEKLGFAPAVRRGVMVEPPLGDPDMPSVLAALAALDRELFCIVEQDMYPCDFDKPFPIAKRTREYFARCGLGAGRLGAVAG